MSTSTQAPDNRTSAAVDRRGMRAAIARALTCADLDGIRADVDAAPPLQPEAVVVLTAMHVPVSKATP